MKTLATCKPSEFLKQTNRIRKAVEGWLDATEIVDILRRQPELEVAKKDATAEEKTALAQRNKEASEKQARENYSQVLDAILDKNPDETLVLLALCCFVEPEEVDNHTVSEYLQAVNELINDDAVMGFFTSLMRLARMSTSTASKA